MMLMAWSKEKMKAYQKVYRARPEYKAYRKACRATPEYKAYQKAYQATSKYKAYEKDYRARPRYRDYKRVYQKVWRDTPEYKAYQKAYNKVYHEELKERLGISYSNLHHRMRRLINKPEVCRVCKQKKPLQLANISGHYMEIKSDWTYLCSECHKWFDRKKPGYQSILYQVKIKHKKGYHDYL